MTHEKKSLTHVEQFKHIVFNLTDEIIKNLCGNEIMNLVMFDKDLSQHLVGVNFVAAYLHNHKGPVDALCLAARHNKVNVLNQILSISKFNVDVTTSWQAACKDGCLDVVAYLLEKHVLLRLDPNATDAVNFTGLEWACQNGHKEVVKMILEAKFIGNAMLGMHLACSEGHYDIVQFFINEVILLLLSLFKLRFCALFLKALCSCQITLQG
jgi:ankyrin repeat protein